MKRIFYIFITSLLVMSCNDKAEKKTSIKIGQISVSESTQDNLKLSIERGAALYSDFCMQCHLSNGKGIPGNFPPLAGSNWLTEKRKESIHSVKFGQSGEIEVNGVIYNGVMTPMGLSNKEIADVLNYVMNSWGNKQTEIVTEEEVAAVKK